MDGRVAMTRSDGASPRAVTKPAQAASLRPAHFTASVISLNVASSARVAKREAIAAMVIGKIKILP